MDLIRGKRLERTIAERYSSDRLVRGRVDSFVRLFERLLDTMGNSSKGEALVEACLASESGHIYVMLAAIAAPYETKAEFAKFELAPEEREVVTRTFCGT